MFARLKSAVTGWLPSDLSSRLPSSTTLTRLLPLVMFAIALTALATLYMRYEQANYKPLFGAREPVQFDDVVSVLDADGIGYRIHPDTGQVLVSNGNLARARMILAARGVTAKPAPGLDQVDRDDPLGTSQFVQDVRFRRGLEAELAQSIATLDPVERARVHLSIAKSSSFVMMDGEKSAASVVLTLKPGRHLSKEQIAAVINLVAGSVPNLAPAQVAIVDQHGAFLSARVDLDGDLFGDDAATRIRDEVARNVHSLLAPSLGSGSFRVSVTAVVNNDRVEETREQYGAEPKVLNEATRDEENRDRVALGVPGSLSNRPVDVPAASGAAADGGTRRNATTRQFAYDRSIWQIKRGRGQLEKLSVAVVLDNAASPTKGKPWSADQLGRIDGILRGGLGIDAARGDQLIVSSLDFAKAPPEQPWWQRADTLEQGGWYLTYGLAALFGCLLIARPLLRMMQQWVQHTYGGPASATATPLPPQDEHDEHAAAAPGQGREGAAPGRGMPLLGDIELPPAGSGLEVLIDYLHTLSEKEPERVAEVVKQWIRNDGHATQ